MSVKEAVAVKSKKNKNKIQVPYRAILQHSLSFVLGLLFSMAGFNGNFSPFGAAFTASVAKNLTVTTAVGAAVGWFVSLDSVSAFRYTSVVLAICVIMGALKPFKQVRDNAAAPSICVFVCLFVTGLAIAFAEGISVSGFILCFAEAVLGSASAFLFSKCKGVLSIKGGISMLTSKEATSIAVCGMLLLLALKNISFFGIYPAHIIASFLILTCAYYGKEAGGAIVGVCGGITMSLAGGDVLLLGFYSFGGLLAGVFSGFGRLASFAAFVFSGVALPAIAYENFGSGTIITETIIAGAFFLILTTRFDEKFKSVLKPAVVSPVTDIIKNGVFNKLHKASKISTEIYTSLADVSDKLSKSEKSSKSAIIQKTRERVCGSCGLYDVCWGEGYEDTQDIFNTLLNLKKEGVYLEYKTVPQHFSGKCIRTENIASSFNKLYLEYVTRSKTENRIREMHTLASEQFVNVASLLDSLNNELMKEVCFDIDTASRVRAASVACGFEPLQCTCVIKDTDKMVIEVQVKNPGNKQDISSLSKQVSLITNRSFELPVFELRDDCTVITFKEKADFKVLCAAVQNCATGERFSGDTFSTFEDGEGKFYAIICDGMGTGTKAALASGLAVSLLEKLIKAGFGIKASINTVNSSLVSRSGEECSVTLDMAVVDLFTGRIDFYKCAAADTTVKKGGKLFNISYSSLPLGIISRTEISCGTGSLDEGDMLIMTSDGVREEDLLYVRRELKAYKGDNLRCFTVDLCENIRRYQVDKQDDLTILSLLITKNE